MPLTYTLFSYNYIYFRNNFSCFPGITLDKIFGPLRAADRAAAAGGGGSVVQPAVKAARSYAISSKVMMKLSIVL